ncbi:hypothetical protein [Sorangium sp. So ce1000]|uniref:hypothetical protein n=1 Tax=Sorangium sp. So ce1000 TaxID=3133325 RepID=UPI003F614A50
MSRLGLPLIIMVHSHAAAAGAEGTKHVFLVPGSDGLMVSAPLFGKSCSISREQEREAM